MSSKMGMIVGGVLVVFVAIFVIKFTLYPSPSEPTSVTTNPGALKIVEMSRPLSFVLGSEPGGAGNAGEDYNKALQSYRANRDTWGAFEIRYTKAKGGVEEVVGPRELELLREMAEHCHRGAQKAKMDFCGPYGAAPLVTVMTIDQADSVALTKIMGYMQAYATYLFLKARDMEEAREAETVAKDLLIMGWHAAKERAYPACTIIGFTFQQQICLGVPDADMNYRNRIGLIHMYTKYPGLSSSIDMADRVMKYAQSARMAAADAGRLGGILTNNPNPGDFFKVIDEAEDPAWRVQALLGLGIIRHRNEGHRGDKRYTEELLAKYAVEGTEMEKRAAKAALEIPRAEALRGGPREAPEP